MTGLTSHCWLIDKLVVDALFILTVLNDTHT